MTITLVFSKNELLELENKLKHCEKRNTPNYALYAYKIEDCIVTAYQSGKLLIQGNHADEIAALLQNNKPTNTNSHKISAHCGSDEVGTGDYFGGVCVCACYVSEDDLVFLKPYQIMDSKQIKDDKICELAPILMQRLTYSLLIVDNEKYNQVQANNNMVAIKAKLHNQAYVHLKNKLGFLSELCVVDQFVKKESYYRYLACEKQVIEHLHFETKAENKYLAVACASIIARYAFLKQLEALDKQYDFHFEKGAGSNVDACIKAFIEKYDASLLYKVAKYHFKNTQKVLNN